jgi:hypothetical protein
MLVAVTLTTDFSAVRCRQGIVSSVRPHLNAGPAVRSRSLQSES